MPRFVERELRADLECGVLEFGFLRLHCDDCGFDRLLPFSCKGRAFCPSCGGQRMARVGTSKCEIAPASDNKRYVKLASASADFKTTSPASILLPMPGDSNCDRPLPADDARNDPQDVITLGDRGVKVQIFEDLCGIGKQ